MAGAPTHGGPLWNNQVRTVGTATKWRARKKHGNTLVRTLRKIYGQHFAEGCGPDEKLSDVLHKLESGHFQSSCTITSTEN